MSKNSLTKTLNPQRTRASKLKPQNTQTKRTKNIQTLKPTNKKKSKKIKPFFKGLVGATTAASTSKKETPKKSTKIIQINTKRQKNCMQVSPWWRTSQQIYPFRAFDCAKKERKGFIKGKAAKGDCKTLRRSLGFNERENGKEIFSLALVLQCKSKPYLCNGDNFISYNQGFAY